MSQSSKDEVSEYVEENRDMLARILRHGSEEARAYAIAVIIHSEKETDVEKVKQEVEKLVSLSR